jgi:hypothetical protein
MSLSAKVFSLFAGALVWFFVPVFAMAGTNPISISMTPSAGLPGSTSVGSSYAVTYTITNNLPFAEPIKQTDQNIQGLGFTVNDACSNRTLAKNGSCTIDVIYHPVQSGAASLGLITHYDNNAVPFPTLSTTTIGSATDGVSGVVTTRLPSTTRIGVGYSVKFSFTNNSDVSITASSVPLTGDTSNLTNVINGCTAALAAHQTCNVTATYTPSAAGSSFVGATYFYSAGTKSVALSTSTVASGGSGGCAQVDGSANLLLPTSTYIYADNVVQFQFTNNCDSASATLGAVNWSASIAGSRSQHGSKGKKNSKLASTNVTSWLTTGVDNCSNTTLPADGSCTVTATIVPQGTGNNLLVNAAVSYSESSQSKQASASTTSSAIALNNSTNRVVTVINQCDFPVWMTFNAGNVSNNGKPCTPGKVGQQDCPGNSTCNTAANAGDGLCYWTNPSLDGAHPNGLLVGAQSNTAPDKMDIVIPETYGDGVPGNTIYNAGIEGRLNCTGTGVSLTCGINTCTTGTDGMCFPGSGPGTTPVAFNAVEFTFNHSTAGGATDGVYNDQIIDGINVPIEMKGRGPYNLTSNLYNNFQAAGANIQPRTGSTTTQLGNCTYAFSPPGDATNYRYVTEVGPPSPSTLCDTDGDCSGGNICGLGYDSGSNTINKICGTLQGYVSVNKGICSQNGLFGVDKSGNNLQTTVYNNTFHCNVNYGAYTAPNLYACSGSLSNSSCYNNASPCCGCVDWWTSFGGSIAVPTDTVSCNGVTNTDWNSLAQPTFQWVKSACPTSYVYQYDDKSSSFNCTVTSGSNIVTNYQVTFCPGGKKLTT